MPNSYVKQVWHNEPLTDTPLAADRMNYLEGQYDAAMADAAVLYGADLRAWAPSTNYAAGQTVISPSGGLVSAVATHTSGTSFTAANWTYRVPSVWLPNTAYAAGQQVVSPGGSVVTANVAFTSGASYSPANWNSPTPYQNVKDFGAKGDGVTDDSAAIRAACTQAGSGGAVFFPPGTYLVSPNGTGTNNYCIPLSFGVKMLSVGNATIKLITASPNTYGIIGPITDGTDLSGLRISHLTFDMNGDNNALTDPATQLGSGNARRAVAAFAGSGILLEHSKFINGQCTWYAEFLGATLDKVTVDSCTFENAGSNTQDWDHTSLYMDCTRGRVTNNRFLTTKTGGARQGFELHGGTHHARGNIIDGYVFGADVTGSQWRGPAAGSLIGNSFLNVTIAINVWSMYSPAGQDGVQNFLIADNVATLNHAKQANVNPCAFVATNFGSNRPINGLTIRGNNVRLVSIGAPSSTQDQYSQAFSFIRSDGTGITDRNIVITDNIIDGAAAGAFRYSSPSGTIDGLRIEGNVFRNVGQLGSSAYAASRNAAALIDAATGKSIVISRNQYLDNAGTHTLGGGILINPATISDCQTVDNRIWLADGASIVPVVTTNTTGQTYFRMTTQNWTAPTGRFVRGSMGYDENSGVFRTQTAVNGQTWVTSTPGLVSDMGQSSAGATLGSVVRKVPWYNAAGTLMGYMPIYDNIT